MRLKSILFLTMAALILLGAAAWADQIVLKDGTVYSGKFIRGDAKVIDFRVLGRIESFKLTDVSQIIFKEPELATPAVSPKPTVPGRSRLLLSQWPGRVHKQRSRQSSLNANGKEDILPAGTPISIRTSSAIDTDRNRVGDIFDATLEEALISGNRTLLPEDPP